PLHVAVQKFEEAAKLDGRWPDPYLGLARTYIYGLDDLDRAIAALHEAEDRGYRPGNRELVQLADGYRSRGDRMRRDAQSVRGLDQEKDYLEKALEAYRQSFDLYRQAMGFGDVSANMRQMQDRIDEAQKRLDEIKGRGLGDLLRDIFRK
ncbi:MAG: serine/threonine protein kinase, partial [Acidobacteria bacterium]|nr:serine/threonine protein kinase [Acidobacteriota bacterium]